MMKYDSPTVQRSITPSPLHVTPAWSREQLCDLYPTDLYSTRPPRFLLDALEGVSDTSVPIELPKHFLPNFPFRVVNGRPDPTVAEMREIITYFPGCTGVAYAPPYLVVKWPRAQMKPWPLTVRGMPLYYATPDRPFPPTYGKGGRSPPIMKGIHERLKPWESPSNNLIEGIARMLVEKGIGLKLFGWCGVRWYAEVDSVADGMNMPRSICGLLLTWEVFSGFGESTWGTSIPTEHIIDNTCYKPSLRPGVLLESKGRVGTTSGIPIKGPNGKRFFTVARHGFKLDGDQEVHHPLDMGGAALLGRMQDDDPFPGSDIGLSELEDGMTYSTVSFDGEEVDGTNLEGFAHSENLNIGDILCMDNPYNGRCEGLLGLRGVAIIDLVDIELPQFLFLNMIYFGNGASDIVPGSCGSAIWNDKNKVIGIFRWYDLVSGMAYAPSVNTLIEDGYTLERIP